MSAMHQSHASQELLRGSLDMASSNMAVPDRGFVSATQGQRLAAALAGWHLSFFSRTPKIRQRLSWSGAGGRRRTERQVPFYRAENHMGACVVACVSSCRMSVRVSGVRVEAPTTVKLRRSSRSSWLAGAMSWP